ncbi:lipoprotein [Mesoplasma seiffertii]|uniref:lipoprotein n=1 Tax=Mesoplasma seiffertii TaxID=28224 RepID=UPI00056C28BF|nr:lipoprotein [Mesoplasma seiffertii]
MKKLLTLLGALSLITTAGTTAVACGKKNVVKPPTNENYEETLKDFKNDLNKLTAEIYSLSENQAKFTRAVPETGDSSSYNLFNLDFLLENYENDSEKDFSWDLSEQNSNIDAQALMTNDLNKLFTQLQFEKAIYDAFETGENAIKYRNIYLGNAAATLGEFQIVATSPFVLKNTKIDGQEIYSIELTVTKKMYFNDNNNVKTSFSTNQLPIKIVVGEEGAVLSLITNVVQNLPKELYNTETNSTKLKLSDFRKTNPNFKSYGILDHGIAKYINSAEFKDVLETSIKNQISTAFTANVEFGDEIVNQDEVSVQKALFDNIGLNQIKWWADISNNALLNSFLLKRSDTKAIEKDLVIKEIKNSTHDYEALLEAFDSSLEKFLNEIPVAETQTEEIISQTYNYGTFVLSNIKIKINSGEEIKELPIPTITVPWTYTNDLAPENSTKEDAFFAEIYDSILIANNYMLQINNDQDTKPLEFLKLSETLDSDIKTLIEEKTEVSWTEILAKLDLSPNNEVTFFELTKQKQYQIQLVGTQMSKTLQTEMNFAFDGFRSWIQLDNSNHVALKKTADGKIGIGLSNEAKTIDGSYIEYKLQFGNTRIQSLLPMFKQNDGGQNVYTGDESREQIVDKDVFGSNLSEQEYANWVMKNKANWLLLQLKK